MGVESESWPEARAAWRRLKRNFNRVMAQRALAKVVYWTPTEDALTLAALRALIATMEYEAKLGEQP